MDRRTFLTGVAGLAAAPLTAEAQQPAKIFRIGILGTYPPTTPEVAHLWEAFIQGLRALGYVEGQNLAIERRFSGERVERLPELATELVRLNVSSSSQEVSHRPSRPNAPRRRSLSS